MKHFLKKLAAFIIAFPIILVAYLVFILVVMVIMLAGLVMAPTKVWNKVDEFIK